MKTSSLLVTELVNNWARKKFASQENYWMVDNVRDKFRNADHFEIDQEKRSEGYCETCWSEYTAVVVYAVDAKGKRTEIWEHTDVSLVELMQEILDANQE